MQLNFETFEEMQERKWNKNNVQIQNAIRYSLASFCKKYNKFQDIRFVLELAKFVYNIHLILNLDKDIIAQGILKYNRENISNNS